MLSLLDSLQCISGFISSDEIKIQAREITSVRGYRNDERFFPDIGFTCNGNITHIIIGAEDQMEYNYHKFVSGDYQMEENMNRQEQTIHLYIMMLMILQLLT